MNQTTNYQLSQWDGEDRILRENFNADNVKIDAALAALVAGETAETQARTTAVSRLNGRFYTSSFKGDGSSSGNRSIFFPRKPLFVVFAGEGEHLLSLPTNTYGLYVGHNSSSVSVAICSLSGSTFSWRKDYCNRAGITYQVFAILEA